jgi:spore coat polysaccharide biosynthesis protein SpsF
MRKLVAALACRNDGARLYGKPLQNLDVESGITVIRHIVDWLRTTPEVDEIVLGISEGIANLVFIDVARKLGVPYIIGDEKDVLGRLIQCGDRAQATDVLRLTTESPFSAFETIPEAWGAHVEGDQDFSCLDDVPAGCGFEIIKLEALKVSHRKGADRHRSELCSLYIRENRHQFKIRNIEAPSYLGGRTDLRLAIDYPEDLVLCRTVYANFRHLAPRIPVAEIVTFLDGNPDLRALVEPLVQPTLSLLNR